MDNKYKTVLKRIPELLSSSDDINENFEKIIIELKSTIDFDNVYICYLNAGCANIQYRKKFASPEPISDKDTVVNFPEILKNKLYDTQEAIAFDENSGFFNALNLKITNSTFLLIKLGIKNTVLALCLFPDPKISLFLRRIWRLHRLMPL